MPAMPPLGPAQPVASSAARVSMLLNDARARTTAIGQISTRLDAGDTGNLRSLSGKAHALADVLDGLSYTVAKSGANDAASVLSNARNAVTQLALGSTIPIGTTMPLALQVSVSQGLHSLVPGLTSMLATPVQDFLRGSSKPVEDDAPGGVQAPKGPHPEDDPNTAPPEGGDAPAGEFDPASAGDDGPPAATPYDDGPAPAPGSDDVPDPGGFVPDDYQGAIPEPQIAAAGAAAATAPAESGSAGVSIGLINDYQHVRPAAPEPAPLAQPQSIGLMNDHLHVRPVGPS
ncbi:MAG: hypothetical protein H7123_08450 [Thermoleophilia bacterium]|nr:hypothetical protein [Thermoleophilia bacterium]